MQLTYTKIRLIYTNVDIEVICRSRLPVRVLYLCDANSCNSGRRAYPP